MYSYSKPTQVLGKQLGDGEKIDRKGWWRRAKKDTSRSRNYRKSQ
jgi:hypothetical protein